MTDDRVVKEMWLIYQRYDADFEIQCNVLLKKYSKSPCRHRLDAEILGKVRMNYSKM